jgi:uncharacterized iron-regulated membrane protein
MSYLTSYYPQTIKAFLETRPALAGTLEVIGLIFLIYSPVGLLILWRIKFYRPKPAPAKEPSPLRLFLSEGLVFDVIVGAIFLFMLFCGLVVLLAIFSSFVYSVFTTPLGKWPWVEWGLVTVIFLFSVFCIWLSARK